MAGGIKIRVTGTEELTRVMRNINPQTNPEFVRRSLVKGGLLVQRNAAEKQIKRGGNAPPLPDRLTSRTGTGRRSIRVDRRNLSKFFVDIGSDLAYMQLHETGGTVSRGGRAATFPRRAYMAPALEAVNTELGDIFAKELGKESRK